MSRIDFLGIPFGVPCDEKYNKTGNILFENMQSLPLVLILPAPEEHNKRPRHVLAVAS